MGSALGWDQAVRGWKAEGWLCPGRTRSCGGGCRGAAAPVPMRSTGAAGAQQPLFLRMKACPRTACSISTKAKSPTVTAQGPSARNPHFW